MTRSGASTYRRSSTDRALPFLPADSLYDYVDINLRSVDMCDSNLTPPLDLPSGTIQAVYMQNTAGHVADVDQSCVTGRSRQAAQRALARSLGPANRRGPKVLGTLWNARGGQRANTTQHGPEHTCGPVAGLGDRKDCGNCDMGSARRPSRAVATVGSTDEAQQAL